MKIAILVFLAMFASAAPALAQEQELVLGPKFEQRFAELAKWSREYRAWEKWFEMWGNRVARNFDDQLIWERKKRPEPPDWLAAECQGYLGVDDLLAGSCHILRHWDEQPVLILQRRQMSLATSGGQADEKVVKSSFYQRVHLTALWTQSQYPAPPAYGIVGMQIGVFEAGRLTLPSLGVMLVMIPHGDGSHDWKPATTLGFGYRICDFVPPFMKKQVSLHFNIARTTVHGAQGIIPVASNLNLFGLSVSPRHR